MLERARPLRFTLAWVGAAVLLLPLSIVIGIAIGLIFAVPALLVPEFGLPDMLITAPGYLFLATFAAAMGWCIGALQQLVTRRYLRFEFRHWREFSAFGVLLAGSLSGYVCSQQCEFDDISLLWVQPSLRPAGGLLFSLLLFLGILSAVQFLTLCRQASAAALWVIARLVSLPLAYAFWRNQLAIYFPYTESHLGIIPITPFVAALVTGAVMLRIVSLSSTRDKPKRKAAQFYSAAIAPPEARVD